MKTIPGEETEEQGYIPVPEPEKKGPDIVLEPPRSLKYEQFVPVSVADMQALVYSLACDSQTKIKILDIISEANHNQKKEYTIDLIAGMTITVKNGVVTKV